MAFSVEIEPQAFEDLDSLAGYIKSGSNVAVAGKWFNGIMDDIASLQDMPTRCPVAPELAELGQEIRILLHGRKNRAYKIFFSINYETPTAGLVQVLHVRHWARKPLTAEDLQVLMDDEKRQA